MPLRGSALGCPSPMFGFQGGPKATPTCSGRCTDPGRAGRRVRGTKTCRTRSATVASFSARPVARLSGAGNHARAIRSAPVRRGGLAMFYDH